MSDTLLFEVIVDGHSYKIFAEGHTEGFVGERVWIFNHFPRILQQCKEELSEDIAK